jgi:hypothetical protein
MDFMSHGQKYINIASEADKSYLRVPGLGVMKGLIFGKGSKQRIFYRALTDMEVLFVMREEEEAMRQKEEATRQKEEEERIAAEEDYLGLIYPSEEVETQRQQEQEYRKFAAVQAQTEETTQQFARNFVGDILDQGGTIANKNLVSRELSGISSSSLAFLMRTRDNSMPYSGNMVMTNNPMRSITLREKIHRFNAKRQADEFDAQQSQYFREFNARRADEFDEQQSQYFREFNARRADEFDDPPF